MNRSPVLAGLWGLLVLAGCQNPALVGHSATNGAASLTLTWSSERSFAPAFADVATYRVTLSAEGQESLTQEVSTSESSVTFRDLALTTWTVTLEGLSEADVAVVRDQKTANLTKGGNVPVSLKPSYLITGSGTGDVDLGWTWASIETAARSRIQAATLVVTGPDGQDVTNAFDTTFDPEGGRASLTSSNVAVGNYEVVVTLTGQGASGPWTFFRQTYVIAVYWNTVTSGVETLTLDEIDLGGLPAPEVSTPSGTSSEDLEVTIEYPNGPEGVTLWYYLSTNKAWREYEPGTPISLVGPDNWYSLRVKASKPGWGDSPEVSRFYEVVYPAAELGLSVEPVEAPVLAQWAVKHWLSVGEVDDLESRTINVGGAVPLWIEQVAGAERSVVSAQWAVDGVTVTAQEDEYHPGGRYEWAPTVAGKHWITVIVTASDGLKYSAQQTFLARQRGRN